VHPGSSPVFALCCVRACRYAAKKWPPGILPTSEFKDKKTGEMVRFKPKVDIKGLDSVRRDKIPFTKELVAGIIERILDFVPWQDICQYVFSRCELLCKNELDMYQVIQSKSCKLSYSSRCIQQVIQEKMQRRDPATAPHAGDRVYFVYVKTSGREKNLKGWQQVEEPLYALENNLQLDYKKIGESCVKNSVMLLLSLVIPEGERQRAWDKMFRPFDTQYHSEDSKSSGGLSRFAVPKDTCRVCHVDLVKIEDAQQRPGIRVLCEAHKDHYADLQAKYTVNVAQRKQQVAETYEGCQKCMGVRGNPSQCANRACEIFWRRVKEKNDCDHVETQFARLNMLDW
jgi:DNA polymerase delta subunit 1